MRDRMERFVILPFSVGCVSESSVAVAVQQPPRRSKPAASDTTNSSTATIRKEEGEGEEEESLSSDQSMKYPLKFLPLPKPDISNSFHRLFKSFKTLSQLFAYKEEMEESEKEMEIGLPTDVKHVTHIGLDGSASTSTSSSTSNWDNLFSSHVHDLFTFPSVPTSGQLCELPLQTPAAAAASAASSPLLQAST